MHTDSKYALFLQHRLMQHHMTISDKMGGIIGSWIEMAATYSNKTIILQ